MKIIGRAREQDELKRYYESGRPEFIAITGRRRVGKTFLVKEYFSDDMVFYFSGASGKNVTNKFQLRRAMRAPTCSRPILLLIIVSFHFPIS